MAKKKKTIAQKREVRREVQAKKKKIPKTAKPLDKLVADLNAKLGAGGRVYLGADIAERSWERRSWGIPSLDFITNGGLPKGGLVEVGGEFSCGKTTSVLHACSRAQRMEPEKAIGWVALEPFSKRWARENSLWIPYNEDLNPTTGEPLDGFERASALERLRMEQSEFEDPYSNNGVADVVLVQEERGDVALDVAISMLKSNLFSIIVVDSIGVAKNTAFIEDQEVQDASDFPREPRMLSNYTARALLAMNCRYDENNQPAADGEHWIQTTVININQIGRNIGSQSRAPWNQYTMKGGEGIKHNHHIVVFLWKGQQQFVKEGSTTYSYAQEVKAVTIKNKLGTPFLQGAYDFYYRDYDQFSAGDIDVAKDVVTLGIMAGYIQRAGAWFEIPEVGRWQGRAAIDQFFRDDPEMYEWLLEASMKELHK